MHATETIKRGSTPHLLVVAKLITISIVVIALVGTVRRQDGILNIGYFNKLRSNFSIVSKFSIRSLNFISRHAVLLADYLVHLLDHAIESLFDVDHGIIVLHRERKLRNHFYLDIGQDVNQLGTVDRGASGHMRNEADAPFLKTDIG